MGCFLKLKGCFCLSLRTGNLIILCLFLVCSVAALLQFIITGFEASVLYYALYVILLLVIPTSSLALYGLHKKEPSFLIPSLIVSVFILLITFSEIVVLIIFEFALHKRAPAHGDFGKNKLPYTVIVFLSTWFFACVQHSYYLELEEELKNQTGQ